MSTIRFDFADKTSVEFGVMRIPNRARPALVKFRGANVDVLAYFRSDVRGDAGYGDRENGQKGDQMTKPTNVFLPYICQAFGNAAKEYEKHKTLPCPKPAFDGWGEVNELMSDLATSLSATTGVEIVWDASPDAMINPLGEFGCFEKKETK